MIKCAGLNILEGSAVSLTSGAEDPSYPLYRLYDRDAGRLFRAAEAGTVEVRVDQGASPLEVDRLIVPAGHNLDGAALEVLHSDDDASYSPAVPGWAQSGTGLINKSWTAVASRYWKFKVTTPASASQAKYGAYPGVVDFELVRDALMASHVLQHMLLERKEPRLTVEFAVFWEHFDLAPGDTVEIDGPLYGGRNFLIESVRRLDKFRAGVRAREWW